MENTRSNKKIVSTPTQPYYKDSKFLSGKDTIRQLVFDYLKNHPFQERVNHKRMAKDLGLPYERYKGCFYQLSHQYKTDYAKQQGLKGFKFHKWHGWIYALKSCDRELALKTGWEKTKARNRFIVWNRDRNALGRLEWFETGRVNIFIKKPATKGKVFTLLAHAFHITGLIFDLKLFSQWAKTFRIKGEHVTADTGKRLPYLKIDQFKESTGFVVVLGDRSHPTSVEIQLTYPDWAERNELLFEQITTFFKGLMGDSKAKEIPKRLYG